MLKSEKRWFLTGLPLGDIISGQIDPQEPRRIRSNTVKIEIGSAKTLGMFIIGW